MSNYFKGHLLLISNLFYIFKPKFDLFKNKSNIIIYPIMGIKNLTQLIKHKSPNSIQHIGLYTFKGKRVAIDTSIFLYKSLINVRSKGDYYQSET